ncbi:MAG: hypothetical protein ACRC6X_08700 [Culicoidibacterales bacterium]
MKKSNKKLFKIEKMIIAALLAVAIATPFLVLTLTSVSLAFSRDIVAVDKEIEITKQEVNELEVEKQEKLKIDRIEGYAAEGGLAVNQDRVRSVN